MASFEELQAIAAARSKASQDKLAAERASREAAEKAKKVAHDEKLRLNAAKDREMMIAKEQRRKREEEEKKRLEEEKRKRMEKREYEIRMKERETLDKAKFQSAAHKAFKKILSSAKEKEPKGRRMGRNESVSPPPNQREHSTLTREEKRQRKEAAMLGLTSSSKRKSSSSYSNKAGQGSNGLAVGALHALGTNKRDTRTVDEIERDLIAARQERLRMQGRGVHRDRIGQEERKEEELEGMLRRQKAMQAKKMGHEGALLRDSPMSSDDHLDASSERSRKRMKKRSRSPSDERPVMQKRPIISAVNIPYGFSPADYLPGAPIKTMPKVISKERTTGKKVLPSGNKSSKTDKKQRSPEPTIPKKETARDKFLREEAERKRKMAKKSQHYEESDDDDDDDNDSDEEESYDSDLPRAKQSEVSRQIWQMFNRRDKSEYLARDIDSDDEDMEADMESVRREELRSAKLARMEDEKEEAEQKRREQEKARRKAEKRRA